MKGKKYTPREIDDLRHSKRWRERCDPFLKKEIKSGPVIGQAIEEWIVEFKDKSDSMGRSLFTRNTEKIAREQVKKVQCDKILAISKYSESGFRTGQGALIGTMVMTPISVAFGCCCTESMILAFFRLWKIEYYGQVFVD